MPKTQQMPQIETATLDQYEHTPGQLASNWRATRNDGIVREYQLLLEQYMRHYPSALLDIDALLPERFLPAEYLERTK